jgi:hypothetical protein
MISIHYSPGIEEQDAISSRRRNPPRALWLLVREKADTERGLQLRGFAVA